MMPIASWLAWAVATVSVSSACPLDNNQCIESPPIHGQNSYSSNVNCSNTLVPGAFYEWVSFNVEWCAPCNCDYVEFRGVRYCGTQTGGWGLSGTFQAQLNDSIRFVSDDGVVSAGFTLCQIDSPTVSPTEHPSTHPTASPTGNPTVSPTVYPTLSPSASPTASPTEGPTKEPTAHPSASPTASPTKGPTKEPTAYPSAFPTANPTTSPSPLPTETPESGEQMGHTDSDHHHEDDHTHPHETEVDMVWLFVLIALLAIPILLCFVVEATGYYYPATTTSAPISVRTGESKKTAPTPKPAHLSF